MYNTRFLLRALIAAVVLFSSATAQNQADHPRQDGRQIERLEWSGPPGVLPGTYAEYLATHPPSPAEFNRVAAAGSKAGADISILIDADLYPDVTEAVDQYIADMVADGHSVDLTTVSSGTDQEIKDWVIGQYYAGALGFVFIGDITAAWAEVSGSQFPCDLFYMDLDGIWEDNNSDGIYEVHSAGSGDQAPEVYIGRMCAHSLTYDSETDMVNGYLAKAHAYRNYGLIQPWRALEYVEEDWWDMSVDMDLVYDDSVARYDYGYYTRADDYLDKMSVGRHFTTVCVHSWSGGHHFGTRPTESAAYAHVYVYSPDVRAAKLLLGSDDGIRVWLNGQMVYSNDRQGDWYEDAYETSVFLLEGWNQLLCKVSQYGGSFRFSARFTDDFYNDFDDLQYQINDPDTYPEEGEFVRGWLLNGFHQDVSGNFWNYLTTNYLGVDEGSINPSAGDTTAGLVWTAYSSGCPYVDLSAHEAGDYGCAYAFARVYSDSARTCELWAGYDDGARVWLNGAEVLYDNYYGGFEADMSKAPVSLQAGENRLLVKISQWMGGYGFSLRFCQSDGSPVDGLTYDPVPDPIAHIGTWLVNGPYLNPDSDTRLTFDYLSGEAYVAPSEGDAAAEGVWERCLYNGRPFDIGTFYDRYGDYVYSATIQEEDPPVLFYNLFSCGPGRFTDTDYLAGSYIFNTTTGLITVASAKSGSMLNFQDFTDPLGEEDMPIGQAFLEWFQAQAPFELWEQEWYYGMQLNGDPTLRMLFCVDSDGDGFGDPGEPLSTCTEDNCPDIANPGQEDADGDGVGDACCCEIRGDIDANGTEPDIADLVYLVGFMFQNGPDLPCPAASDVNGDGAEADIADLVYLVSYMFQQPAPGPIPCP